MITKWATPLFLSVLSFMINAQNVCALSKQGQEQSSSGAFQTKSIANNTPKTFSLRNSEVINNPVDSLEDLLSKWDTLLSEVKQQAKASNEDFQLFSNFNRRYLDSEWSALFQLIKYRKINYSNIASYLSAKNQKIQALYSSFIQIKQEYPSSVEPFQHPSLTPPLPIGCNVACTNMDFSAGNFTGWNGYYAANNSTTLAHVFTGITGGLLGAVVRSALDPATSNSYQVHITSRGNNDWFLRNYHAINMSQASPWGNGYSAMIGDSINNGKGMAVLSQEFQVTSTTNSVTYAYSVFLENPAHNYYQQPFFSVTLFDQNGDTIRNCGVYNVVSGPNIPGFAGEYYPPDNHETSGGAGGDTIYWKPWTQVNVPLSNYVGQCVTIQFEVGDCSLGGHCGYAYVDASCSTFTITAASPVICGNGTDVLTGPAGESHYSWTGPSNSILSNDTLQNITVDSAGTYTLVITPVTGGMCRDTLTINITRDIISTTATATDINCNGGTGSATATVINGTGPYTYSWLPSGGTNATASGLSAGSYTVKVTDTHGCEATATVTITQPSALNALATTISNEICNGDNNGSTSVAASGGTGPYSYLWNPSLQTNAIATGLSAGAYTVTVTDANGCTATATTTVNQPMPLTGLTSTISNVSCTGGSNGSASVVANGGTNPYTYFWNPSSQTNAMATGLSAGTYTVTITDANGCTATVAAVITQPLVSLSASTTIIGNVSCTGGSNGIASATAGGGTSPYTYLWNPSSQTNATATGLSAGTYTVTVTDLHGCTASATAIIVQPLLPLSVTAMALGNVSCTGGSNGIASATAVGGTSPYSYLWNPSGQTNATATGLSAGTYTVTITDLHGCTASASAIITQPLLVLSASTTIAENVSCTGGSNGSASASASGGTNPYTYLWNPSSQTNATATGLSAGTYTVTITDFNGCTASATAIITQPLLALSASTTIAENVSCTGGSNGSASVIANGGTSPFTYLWNPSSQTSATATGLSAGTYTVTITDLHGCTASATAIITQPLLVLSASTTIAENVSCTGGSNGSASASASGGTSPYNYLWNPSSQRNATATGLSAGTYTVTVTDLHGCTTSATAVITQPLLVLSASATASDNVSCMGGSNGRASVTANGGTGPYTYLWTPSVQTNITATGLSAGTYTVTVTDFHGCTTSASVVVTQPLLALSGSATTTENVNCTGGSGGRASVVANGGTSPYNYLWTPSVQTNITATGLSAGTYTVTITDLHGCTASASAVITQPLLALTASTTALGNVNCTGGANGIAIAVGNGGTAPYNYLWTPSGQTNETALRLSAGAYTVTVTDAHGCTANSAIIITQPYPLSINIEGSQQTACKGQPMNLDAVGSGGTLPYRYFWSNGYTTSSITIVPVTTQTYTVTLTDANGCSETGTTTITIGSLTAKTGMNVPICSGESTTLIVYVSGGSGSYNYNWLPGNGATASITVTPTVTTIYTVIITDGCSSTDTAYETVVVNPLPDVNFGSDIRIGCAPVCVQFRNSSSVSSGSITESSWDFGDGNSENSESPIHCYTNPGRYTVTLTVTSNSGCSASLTRTNYITVYGTPIAAFVPNPQPATISAPVIQFANQTDTKDSIVSWVWNFGESGDSNTSNISEPFHRYRDTGTYKVTLIAVNLHGCADSVIHDVVIGPDFTLFFPSAFTPNSDGLNDVFFAKGSYVKDFEMSIYDRWGMKLFHTSNINEGWDGRLNGSICQEDVYVYMATASDMSGGTHQYSGKVTLLK